MERREFLRLAGQTVAVGAAGAYLAGCGGEGGSTGPGPTPTPAPSPVTISLESMAGGRAVVGAVTANGVTEHTDDSGNVVFSARPSDPVNVVTRGFRVRDTRVGSGLITLFPLGSDYGDEFVDQFLFEPPNLGMLQQPSGTIFYEMGQELAPAHAAIVAGAAIAERAFGIDFQVLGVAQTAPQGAEVFKLSIDPSLRGRGFTSLTQWTGGAYITGGTIAFVELTAAQFAPLVAHESGHAGLALGHPSVQRALMNRVVDGSLTDFTLAEKTVGRLSLQRMAGTVAPDNDVAVKSGFRSKGSVGCYAIY